MTEDQVAEPQRSIAENRSIDTRLQLYISSGNHITRPQRRIKEIETALNDIDVVFVESPRSANSPGWRTVVMNFLAAPILVATMYLWVSILTIWSTLTAQEDHAIVKHLENKYDAEVIPTDRNVHRLIEKERGVWALGHYIVILLFGLAIPTFMTYTPEYTTPGKWLVLLCLITGAGIFVLFLAGTIHARDMQFVRDIESYALTHKNKNACLVVGGQHEPGVREGLKENNYVDILDP